VFKYKSNKKGYTKRFKVQLVFWRDLQPPTIANTYVAMVAAKSFLMMMAIAAKWDLII
jgi:hypothetical protein